MKRNLVILCCVVGLVFGGCRSGMEYQRMEGKIYGTYYHISYAATKDYQREIRAEMERVNASLSMFNRESVMARLNRNESDSTDALFRRMFSEAMEVYRRTNGAFDITVAPLVNAWGFGYEKKDFPDSARIDSLLERVGMEKIKLQEGKLLKLQEGVQMDASSIAKGLGVDLVAEFLELQGIEHYMVEIGGEVRVKGKSSKGRSWRIGVDRPEEDVAAQNRELQMVVALDAGALATSGNYRNFYIHEGKKYAHTINPVTGYPVQTEILSASVYAAACMKADAYATAFMVMGLEKAKAVVQADSCLEACFIYQQEGEVKVWMSEGFEKMIWAEGNEH